MAVTQQLDSLALQMRSALPGQEQYTVNSHSPISAAADAMQAYSELYNKVLDFASLLRTKLSNDARNVAILSTTGADFLFCWLGLLQLGCRVMLIAPEVTTTGIANLLWETGSKVLFHDSKLSHLAHNAIAILAETKRSTCVSHLLPETCDISSYSHPTPIYDMSASDTAYVHHTSGTSTGLPKPISVTHQGAVGALPVLENSGATFTTTPLYHGGPADCFRAWTSGALIWLFPGIGDVPITARNVIEAFLAAKDNAHRSTISYFTAVPYILELLSSSEDGTEILRELQLVGVGGAALSNKVGDKLAKQDGVRLISRYGSAECGFVMSSRRDYDSDTDWQYLYEHDHPGLKFEQQEDGASELILSNMPFMAKYNRGQGVYATSDCFRQHTEKPKRWVYQSRNDSQLSLSTGKKFDPASLETSITELIQRFRTIREVYVFGNGRPYAGILLFRSKGSGLNDAEISDQIWPAIQTANKFSPPHAQIRRQMLVVMPHDSPKLQRSSKGTVMRRQVEETYDNAIQNAYRCQTTVAGRHKSLDVNQLTWNVRRIVRDKLPTNVPASVPDHEDLYKVGADSIVCLEIRDQLQQDYGHSIGSDLSPTVVYDCGSIKGLTEYIYSLHTGDGVTKEEGRSGMEAMVERFRHVYPSDDYGM
ncbi:MAG: hypothetical protein LQ342_003313 [Letrouitia transgressa]|nr:MAG: hypothetical protein LQ342_003313 [Letrouitia transgressa]